MVWKHDKHLYVAVFPEMDFRFDREIYANSHVVLVKDGDTHYRVMKHRYDPKINPKRHPLLPRSEANAMLMALAKEKGLEICLVTANQVPHVMEEGPDGSSSDLLDTIAAIVDTTPCEDDDMLDDLALFIERKGLSDEAQTWLHGRVDGTIKGRTPC